VKYNIWSSKDGLEHTLLPDTEEKPLGSYLVCEILADSWKEAVEIYDDVMNNFDETNCD